MQHVERVEKVRKGIWNATLPTDEWSPSITWSTCFKATDKHNIPLVISDLVIIFKNITASIRIGKAINNLQAETSTTLHKSHI